MTLNPTLRALSSMRRNGVRTMLMGGQACVYYGAAEFSRDLDLLVLADPANLLCLRGALAELETKVIAVPELELRDLERGLAVHFRCFAAGIAGFRIDVMSVLRDMEPFEVLWNRRTVIESEGVEIDMLSLADLVRAKKTQGDQDWPMLRRLVDRSWFQRDGSCIARARLGPMTGYQTHMTLRAQHRDWRLREMWCGNAELTRRTLGWHAVTDAEAGLRKMIGWLAGTACTEKLVRTATEPRINIWESSVRRAPHRASSSATCRWQRPGHWMCFASGPPATATSSTTALFGSTFTFSTTRI